MIVFHKELEYNGHIWLCAAPKDNIFYEEIRKYWAHLPIYLPQVVINLNTVAI